MGQASRAVSPSLREGKLPGGGERDDVRQIEIRGPTEQTPIIGWYATIAGTKTGRVVHRFTVGIRELIIERSQILHVGQALAKTERQRIVICVGHVGECVEIAEV